MISIAGIAAFVHKKGGHLYYVGGYVRDVVMDNEPHDIDLVITGISIEEADKMFERIIGTQAPVFYHSGYEIALARTEKKKENVDNYQGFEFYTSPKVTIKQDLGRRDFTINAMAIHVFKGPGEIVDPYGGQRDINKKIIRHINKKAFLEDSIRFIRAARFAGRYGFKIHWNTRRIIRKNAHRLANQTKERLWLEIKKALMDEKPSEFFKHMMDLGLIQYIFPGMERFKDVPAGPKKWHPEGSTWNHSIEVLQKVEKKIKDPVTRMAALLHDTGKILTPKDRLPSHHGHDDEEAREMVKKWLKDLKADSKYITFADFVVENHMRIREMKPGKLIKTFKRFSQKQRVIDGFTAIAIADDPITEGWEQIVTRKIDTAVEVLNMTVADLGLVDRINEKEGEVVGHMIYDRRISVYKHLMNDVMCRCSICTGRRK